MMAGQPDEAIRSFERAIRLSPIDPLLTLNLTGMGFAFIKVGRLEEAVAAARKAVQRDQTYGAAYRCLGQRLRILGEMQKLGIW
jgi:adenylate cyclase